MRVTLLLCLGLLFGLPQLPAQTTPLRPAELVASHRSELQAGESPSLFTPNAQRGSLDLDHYQLLTLEAEQHAALRHTAPEVLRLDIPAPATESGSLTLELVRVDMPRPTVIESHTQAPVQVDHGVHYRGVLAGQEGSLVALSLWDEGLAAVISSPSLSGNWVLGPLADAPARGTDDASAYVLYQDEDAFQHEVFSCATPDDGAAYTAEELRPQPDGRDLNDCVSIYLEVDHDIYQNKGGTNGAVQYVTALFNQAATLYANESINMTLSEVMVWTTPSPYNGTSSGAILNQFQSIRTSFNGDLAQLLSYKASGGVAVVNGLCHPYTLARMSYAGISSSFQPVPTYSWSVMVMTHELGHLLGSQHTHACVWNGNNSAIDGCAGYTEGGCGNPGLPSGGGTIMSYCHLTSVGINLSRGFGTQPGNLIRNRVANAACLTACPTGGGGGGGGGGGNPGDPPVADGCEDEQAILRLKLDTYTPETSWEIRDGQNTVVAEGGPYPKTLANTLVLDTLCLAEGCYTFTIKDSYDDGICCDYGEGFFMILDANQEVLADGGEFTNLEQADFCLPFQPGGGGDECQGINFNEMGVVSYGQSQDQGQHQIQDNGQTLYIENNAWKAVMLDYEVTPNTVISFDFKSTRQGEIHGIGFDNNDYISYAYTFLMYGTQPWGYVTFRDYPGDGSWKSYTIPVGEYYTGAFDRLFFSADHDSGARNGNAWFRNVRIYEGEDCQSFDALPETAETKAELQTLETYPNPVTNRQVTVEVETPATGDGLITIFSMVGQQVYQETVTVQPNRTIHDMNLPILPPGGYVLRWRDERGEQVTRIMIE